MADEIQIKIPKINLKKIKKNPWILTTIVLAILVIIALLNNGFALGVGKNNAGQNLLEFYQGNGVEGLTLDSVEKVSGMYQVNFEFEGNVVPMYITNDGKYIAQALTPLVISETDQTEPEPQDITKSDKPKVELFVMTHCPYGTQAEKGFIPAIVALGNTIDAEIEFVHYFLHDPEYNETPVQICIREEQESKYLPYLKCFLEEGDTETCLTETGIDQTKLNSCIDNKYEDLYAIDSKLSEDYGVQGSPTLVINGQIVNSARSAAAYLDTICSAFNEKPEECNTELSADNPSAGFGYGTSSAVAQASC